MKRPVLTLFLALAVTALAGAQAAAAGHGHGHGHGHHHGHRGHGVVFVQTNQPDGNAIAVYDRGHDGLLTRAGTYPTGGLGGTAAPGTESDRLASQDSLKLARHGHALIAVNAGSNTVTSFKIHGDRLRRESVVDSGGSFPASVAVHNRLVYVLNAGGTGIVQGFWLGRHGQLRPIADSARSLGLANGDPPNFLMSPGDVAFTPDGSKLLVTTKASTSSIDVFHVRRDGRLSDTPVVNPSATPVPFALLFRSPAELISVEAGASSLTTYRIQHGGTLTGPQSASDGQTAACWITQVGRFYFVSNTGSNDLSSFTIDGSGQPALLQAVAAATPPGPIDLTSSGPFLYVETGTQGTVEEFRVLGDGSLVPLGSVTDLAPGIEGIAAT
jgi:6-phosphogluconolactonase (cycloisomerase 2 family)